MCLPQGVVYAIGVSENAESITTPTITPSISDEEDKQIEEEEIVNEEQTEDKYIENGLFDGEETRGIEPFGMPNAASISLYATEDDANGDGYADSDVETIMRMMSDRFNLNWPKNKPWQWGINLGGGIDIMFVSFGYKPEDKNFQGLKYVYQVKISHRDFQGEFELSNLPYLKSISCTNNQLTKLELSNLPSLEWVECENNMITELNFSNVPKLNSLTCDNNMLTELNLSNLSELKKLTCQNNSLTSIDLSDSPKMEKLSCSGNQIAKMLWGESTDWKTIECEDNQIEKLELKGCKNLIILMCKNNRIKKIDLSNASKLQAVSADNNPLDVLTVNRTPRVLEITWLPTLVGNQELGFGWYLDEQLTKRVESREYLNGLHTYYGKYAKMPTISDEVEIFFDYNKDIVGEGVGNQEVEWDPASWFVLPSTTYNHELAKISMLLSAAAYNETYISTALIDMGFNEGNEGDVHQFNYGGNDKNKAGVTFANRKMVSVDGIGSNLIVVAIRGTANNSEWEGNFEMGLGTHHENFEKATLDIKKSLIEYLKEQKITRLNEAKIIITGHSRGGAVSNLLAYYLTKEAREKSDYFKPNNIYAYTFAAANVVQGSTSSTNYNNIFNFIHGDDFVPQMPLKAWNYGRYGVDLQASKYYDHDMDREFKKLTGVDFLSYRGAKMNTNSFVKNLGKVASTAQAYYAAPVKHNHLNHIEANEYFYYLARVLQGLPGSDIAFGSETALDLKCYGGISLFLAVEGEMQKRLFYSHTPETYISWMNALSQGWYAQSPPSLQTKSQITGPTNIYVYSSEGTLVASVENGIVNIAPQEDVAIRFIDNNSEKKEIIVSPYSDYVIKIEPTANGILEYHGQSINVDTNEVYTTEEFKNVSIVVGKEILVKVSEVEIVQEEGTGEYQQSVNTQVYSIYENGEAFAIDNEGNETLCSEVIISAVSTIGSAVGGGTYAVGDTVTIQTFYQKGYDFLGWYKGNALVSQEMRYSFEASISERFEAIYEPLPKYQITFDGNGGVITNTSKEVMIDETYGELPTPTRTGYSFEGWYTVKTGGTKITQETQVSIANAHVLYAHWKINTYTVKFDGNKNISGAMSNLVMNHGMAKILPANTFKRTGYTFVGWNTKADGKGTAYADKASVKNVNLTLYAQWKAIPVPTKIPTKPTAKTYTIKFNGNKSTSGKMSNLTTTNSETKKLPANKFKRKGYTFAGWNTKANGKGKAYKNKANIKEQNVTLYAQWKKTVYTVKFKGNKSTSGKMSNMKINYGKSKKLTTNKFKRTGYKFVGWNTKANGKGKAYKNKASIKNKNLTLYAQWKKIKK